MNVNRRRWRGRGLLAALAAGLLLGGVACSVWNRSTSTVVPTTTAAAKVQPAAGPPLFRDVTREAGIRHTYQNGQEYSLFGITIPFTFFGIPESNGGGVALLDYDNDGLLDVFITGGGYYDKTEEEYKQDPDHPPKLLGFPCKLYKNLGNWKFKDVTAEVGLDKPLMYSHGAAAADYDRDGWPDLLVAGYGRLALYHNEPVDAKDPFKGRHFVEVTRKAGLTDDMWSCTAAWADLDGDGFPDLYVAHYGNYGFDDAKHQIHPSHCSYDGGTTRDVCPPKTFEALPDTLYHNNGDGTFTDVSKAAGLRVPRTEKDYDELTWLGEEGKRVLREADKSKEYGKGLGVVIVDVNGDGKPDIYVANDTVDNFLYVNRSVPGHIRLEEMGMAAGVAKDDRAASDGSMGTDAADYDNSGRPSLWCVNYEGENHALYKNQCKNDSVFFSWATSISGISAIGQSYVGWGTQFLDLDHDGWLDLFVANGHAIRFPTGSAKRAQRPVLMHNTGKGRFVPITDQGGPYFTTEHCARGVAFGDLDNDGRIDLVINHLNEPAVVLRNEAHTEPNHWLGVQLASK
ncbi:MAG TPA: VCBS repeat-containing protein, partial [Gemmataceae bacterium]|nr:VCBS repeat-containing protein [Gemmataceae bacterium]